MSKRFTSDLANPFSSPSSTTPQKTDSSVNSPVSKDVEEVLSSVSVEDVLKSAKITVPLSSSDSASVTLQQPVTPLKSETGEGDKSQNKKVIVEDQKSKTDKSSEFLMPPQIQVENIPSLSSTQDIFNLRGLSTVTKTDEDLFSPVAINPHISTSQKTETTDEISAKLDHLVQVVSDMSIRLTEMYQVQVDLVNSQNSIIERMVAMDKSIIETKLNQDKIREWSIGHTGSITGSLDAIRRDITSVGSILAAIPSQLAAKLTVIETAKQSESVADMSAYTAKAKPLLAKLPPREESEISVSQSSIPMEKIIASAEPVPQTDEKPKLKVPKLTSWDGESVPPPTRQTSHRGSFKGVGKGGNLSLSSSKFDSLPTE